MGKKTTEESTPGLEEALSKLEQIVQELEKGNLNLDESLKSFENGVKLYKSCRQSLEGAEKKIKLLLGDLKEENWQE
jgi:exodeoxyribonuclease VII small subunit